MPALGFGTLVSDRRETRNATKAAVETGFRHRQAIDAVATELRVASVAADEIYQPAQ
jgi:diketogulonate reductase-like aldo/keto reductase